MSNWCSVIMPVVLMCAGNHMVHATMVDSHTHLSLAVHLCQQGLMMSTFVSGKPLRNASERLELCWKPVLPDAVLYYHLP